MITIHVTSAAYMHVKTVKKKTENSKNVFKIYYRM